MPPSLSCYYQPGLENWSAEGRLETRPGLGPDQIVPDHNTQRRAAQQM